MGIRTAVEHNPLVAAGLLFAIGWSILVGLQIFNQMGSITDVNWVGQHGLGGLMGLLVITVFVALAIGAFAALGESEPAPAEWPRE